MSAPCRTDAAAGAAGPLEDGDGAPPIVPVVKAAAPPRERPMEDMAQPRPELPRLAPQATVPACSNWQHTPHVG